MLRRLAAALLLLLAACGELPHVGVVITNAPSPSSCVPGAAGPPCP